MIKTKYIYYGVMIALLLVLISSTNHIAFTYNSIETYAVDGASSIPLEQKDVSIMSYLISAGFECAMLFLGIAVAERRRNKESTKDLTGFLWFFAFINFFCNLYFALSVNTKIPNLKLDDILRIDYFILFKHCLLAGSLPIVVLSLLEILTIFNKKMRREEKKDLDQKKKEAKELSQKPRASFDDRGLIKAEKETIENLAEPHGPQVTTEMSQKASDEDVKKNSRVEAEPTRSTEENQLREVNVNEELLRLSAGNKEVLKSANFFPEYAEKAQDSYEVEVPIVREPEPYPIDVFNKDRRRIPLKRN